MLTYLLFPISVVGHGNMAWPPTWLEGQAEVPSELESYKTCSTGSCMWFNNLTMIDIPPTIAADSPLRTYNITYNGYDIFTMTPWRAPGYAGPIFSPCGVQGGNPYGCPPNDPNGKDCPGGGFGFGIDARKAYMDGAFRPQVTNWKRGSVQDVLWNIKANHGGGYAYRLCKVPPAGVIGVTEACFQRGHLEFDGDSSWAQWGPDFKNRTEFQALRTSEGTWPKGSQWTKNPVAPCRNVDGGALSETNDECKNNKGFMFDPPAPGLHGFGEYAPGYASTFGFNIVDKVKVPSDIPLGNYVLSFRWDCEQTTQVWTTCSDIKISDDDVAEQGARVEPEQQVEEKQDAEEKPAKAPRITKVLRTLDYANGL